MSGSGCSFQSQQTPHLGIVALSASLPTFFCKICVFVGQFMPLNTMGFILRSLRPLFPADSRPLFVSALCRISDFLKCHSRFYPSPDSSRVHPCSFHQITQKVRFPSYQEPYRVPPVNLLLSASGPNTIIGPVTFIVIKPFDARAFWGFSHVRNELLKRFFPLPTNGNPPPSIIRPGLSLWVKASLFHRLPCAITFRNFGERHLCCTPFITRNMPRFR